MSSPAPRAFSYLRFSTTQQADGDSLRRQQELRDQWCAKRGVTLDTTLNMTDAGVSAYKGKHRANPDRTALAAFVDLANRGRIPRGSYLIVESLDRLSREHIRPALTLLLNLIEAGVRVVQLLPVEAVYDEGVEPMQLLMAIMELSRGHSESKVKSERVAKAWGAKKQKAAEDKKPITRQCPCWLKVVDGAFQVQEGRAAVVKTIFELASRGMGHARIARRLNRDKVPVPLRLKKDGRPVRGEARGWCMSTVRLFLASRSVLGEYQPYRRQDGERKTDGAPIANFYPAIVSPELFHAAHNAMRQRDVRKFRDRGGPRRGSGHERGVNLWQGLLFDARDGAPLYVVTLRRKGKTWTNLARPHEARHAGQPPAFPAGPFEQAILSQLREVSPRDILPAGDKAAARVTALAGELATCEGRIEAVKAQVIDGGDLLPLVDVLRKLEARREKLAAQLAEAQAAAATPTATSWGEFGTLADALATAEDPEEARLRLRSCLRAMVEGIHVLTVRKGLWQILAAQIWFKGDGCRSYLMMHHKRHVMPNWEREEQTYCRSFAQSGLAEGSLDLRKKVHAAKLLRVLSSITPSELAGP
jgi:DNA invertase Pin-like site-specific DNA recombinase